mgnify:CR=1 FL=1
MSLYFYLHLLTWYNHLLKSNKYPYKLTSMSSTLDKTVFGFSTCSFWNYTDICWHFYNFLLLKQLLPWNTTDFPRNFQQQLSQYLGTVKTSLAFSNNTLRNSSYLLGLFHICLLLFNIYLHLYTAVLHNTDRQFSKLSSCLLHLQRLLCYFQKAHPTISADCFVSVTETFVLPRDIFILIFNMFYPLYLHNEFILLYITYIQ